MSTLSHSYGGDKSEHVTRGVVCGKRPAGRHGRPARRAGPSGTGPLDRSLLDTYCVTCHNERLRTAGLTLDTVDISRVGVHAELLEKVVGKLRKGQMPPAGLRGGRHIRYPGTPLANLWQIVLSKMGIPVDQIGDSTGPLDHLTDV